VTLESEIRTPRLGRLKAAARPRGTEEGKMNCGDLRITVAWPRAARTIREYENKGYKLVKRSSNDGQVTLEFESGTSEGDPEQLPE